jgi:hypothetical protein
VFCRHRAWQCGIATHDVVRADEFARLRAQEAADDRAFVDHLLAIPRCDLDLERMELEPRQVTFNGESAG